MNITEFVSNFINAIESMSTDQRAKLVKCNNNADLHYTHGLITAYTQCVAFIKAFENGIVKEKSSEDILKSE